MGNNNNNNKASTLLPSISHTLGLASVDLLRVSTTQLCRLLSRQSYFPPIAVVAPSKAWNDFTRSNTGIVGSNPTWGMDVCVYSVFALFSIGSGFARGWSPIQGVLPCVHEIKISELNNCEWPQAKEPNPSTKKSLSKIHITWSDHHNRWLAVGGCVSPHLKKFTCS
jgi:hypothetical protein